MAAPCDGYPLLIMMEYYPRPGGNVKKSNRAIYNLTEGPIILPFKILPWLDKDKRVFLSAAFAEWPRKFLRDNDLMPTPSEGRWR